MKVDFHPASRSWRMIEARLLTGEIDETNRKRFASTFGSCLFLAVVAAASVALNTDLSAPPRFDGAGYAVLGEALASGAAIVKSTSQNRPGMTTSPPGILLLWLFSGGSPAARSRRLTSFQPSVQWPQFCWPGGGSVRSIRPDRR